MGEKLKSSRFCDVAGDVSIVIVSWNARQYLEECLASVYDSTAAKIPEVIVVDNASTDGSPEMVEQRFPQAMLIRCSENLGFAKANNIGIKETHGRHVALVNSDVKVLGSCFDTLVAFMDRHPRVGLAGPKVLNTDLTTQNNCRRFPSPWNNFCAATGLVRLLGRHRFFSGEQMLDFGHDQVRPVEVLAGCFWIIRREALEAVGLLDQGFYIYAEDVDWCRRCWNAGWQVVFCPEAQAIHHGGGSSVNDPIRFAVEQNRALLRYWRKHHGIMGRWCILAILCCRLVLRYLLAFASRLLGRSAVSDSRDRMRKASACLRALLTEGIAPGHRLSSDHPESRGAGATIGR
ncbi:MAG TPA: glycosyltransferase family 2 protein [Verrucomicrobiae bacterium]|nr:glycosyltransferase family 2 protein [Verrucomicrobiae bacterium]